MKLESAAGEYEDINISSISKPKFKLRLSSENIMELASSIMREGLLHPIVVRPSNGRFQLIAGSRRLAACRLLGLRKIRCHVMELDDRESFEIALTENVARKTLDPLEEARAFKEYTEKYGRGSESELASKIGKSPAYVSKRIKLLSLSKEELETIFRRLKIPSLADELLAVHDDELRAHLISLSTELGLTSKEVRRLRTSFKERNLEERWSGAPYSCEDKKYRKRTHAIRRIIVALRVALYRIDEVLKGVGEDEWVFREMLMQQRLALHSQLDSVCNLRKRLDQIPRPLLTADSS